MSDAARFSIYRRTMKGWGRERSGQRIVGGEGCLGEGPPVNFISSGRIGSVRGKSGEDWDKRLIAKKGGGGKRNFKRSFWFKGKIFCNHKGYGRVEN